MKLTKARVRNFKNIVDSTDVEIQPDVTCLVGKNESGKTAFLHALYRLRPARPNVKFNLQAQYPAWLEKRHRMEGQDLDKFIPVEAEFVLDEDEVKIFEGFFGPGVLTSNVIKLSRDYSNNAKFTFDLNESNAVRNTIDKANLNAEAKPLFAEALTFEELAHKVSDYKGRAGAENEAVRAAGETVEGAVKAIISASSNLHASVQTLFESMTPKFFYFDDYANLPGIVKIRPLLAADPATLNDDLLTARSLLTAAAAEDAYLLNPEYETRKRELENVANAITEEVLKYWTTNPELRVDIDISQRTEPAEAPKNGQVSVLDELRVRLYDNRHLLSLPFDERSTGFRWFFSFIAAFSRYLHNKEPVILLLDEPGLGLHARAQKDFLNFIDTRLAKRCQAIYSTHSPFMVQPSNLDRARVVEDRGRDVGSIVSSDVLTTDPDTLFPLQGALGYDLAQHLFIGPHNLVIEGTSDFAYLTVISDWLREKGRTYLDERWSLVPVGGVDMVPTFIALLGIHLDITVLVDARKQGHQKLNSLAQKGYLKATRIVTIGEILSLAAADIEDLFAVDEYLELYNAAFGKSLNKSALVGTDPIASRIARLEGVDRFDHGRPADVFMRQRADFLPKLSETTLANFERLIERVNSTLPAKK